MIGGTIKGKQVDAIKVLVVIVRSRFYLIKVFLLRTMYNTYNIPSPPSIAIGD